MTRAILIFTVLFFTACSSKSTSSESGPDMTQGLAGLDMTQGLAKPDMAQGLAASCSDGVRDSNETDVDCGGSCGPCAVGKKCVAATDCTSAVCKGDACEAPSCNDGVKNEGETDVDCGGPCPKCANGQSCVSNADCTGACASDICVLATCTDGTLDGNETAVDCGGSCLPCAVGRACKSNTDCAIKACLNSICEVASCTDGKKDGDETDVDCGGAFCPPCPGGDVCATDTDCTTGLCRNQVCVTPTCTDGIQDGTETDVDCGGTTCPKCAVGKKCEVRSDCTGLCVGSICQAPSCTDGVKDGNETDIDCGGTCPGCMNGQACLVNGDCSSVFCAAGVCGPLGDIRDPDQRCSGGIVNNPVSFPTLAQWATSVIAFSSEFNASPAGYSSAQALGVPNTYPAYGDDPLSWSPAGKDNAGEYITLGFPAGTVGTSVWIVETFNPDAVSKVTITTAAGATVIYNQPAVAVIGGCSYVLEIPTGTTAAISQVRIDLESQFVPGYNEFDAVGIIP